MSVKKIKSVEVSRTKPAIPCSLVKPSTKGVQKQARIRMLKSPISYIVMNSSHLLLKEFSG